MILYPFLQSFFIFPEVSNCLLKNCCCSLVFFILIINQPQTFHSCLNLLLTLATSSVIFILKNSFPELSSLLLSDLTALCWLQGGLPGLSPHHLPREILCFPLELELLFLVTFSPMVGSLFWWYAFLQELPEKL